MRKLIVYCIVQLYCSILLAQHKDSINTATDNWSGSYQMVPEKGSPAQSPEQLRITIAKAPDVRPGDVADRYQCDLKRWTISWEEGKTKEKETVRRFLFCPQEKENEYEEFGWTELHKQGKMECLDGGNFFICKTTPNTTVTFNKKETFFTRSGMFAVVLHYGLFNIYPDDKK